MLMHSSAASQASQAYCPPPPPWGAAQLDPLHGDHAAHSLTKS
jgi:hypothetical protein